eukprot:934575-Rhodomonas_salina.2
MTTTDARSSAPSPFPKAWFCRNSHHQNWMSRTAASMSFALWLPDTHPPLSHTHTPHTPPSALSVAAVPHATHATVALSVAACSTYAVPVRCVDADGNRGAQRQEDAERRAGGHGDRINLMGLAGREGGVGEKEAGAGGK